MSKQKQVGIFTALIGAIALTFLFKPLALIGYGQFTWMLFLPMVLFFGTGADIKNVPRYIVCYTLGIAWAFISTLVGSAYALFLSSSSADTLSTITCIFLILLIHDTLLKDTILGSVAALFLGMCCRFFVFMMGVELSPVVQLGIYLYGTLLSCLLVFIGMTVGKFIFGKQAMEADFKENTNAPK